MSGFLDLVAPGSDLSPVGLLILVLGAVLAGGVDAVIGGGGLVLIPLILACAPGLPAQVALGTNKFTAVFGTASAGLRMVRTVRIDWRAVRLCAPLAGLCSAGGALMASAVSSDVLRPVVVVLMLAAGAFVALRPSFGRDTGATGASGVDATPRPSRRRLALGLGLIALIGAYDGFFGPGTGMFLVIVFTALMSRTLIQSLAMTKLVNTATNIGGLVVFAAGGHVLWLLGFVLAVFNVLGAQVGAKIVLDRGTGFVRIALLVLIVVMSAKLIVDML
ncbi:TSUP family transporter [Corynebacterium variabile]|uniref:Probable membrane transporter protein n=1 Tax=Corynebacterium variabile TaxID=1727 RepID=A0A0X2NJH1_9CORY|nr:TSUP family transporter [Corynebacterium variabile]MDN6241280.1 TSUP family transporter [Corynebacterium variabile]MDN6477806.1 TSUP family transporter [Corynebacterium variabile]MDN6536105.1 TSUP family transporter [Corynebacterium variabile]MDN6618451.1 TSUP family transporter [Corynebacterium variabile]MDN6676611.1 TSUP family transporter [Corynebacterium variabile]